MSDRDLFVVSAPSGTGKTTLIREVLARVVDIDFSVSYTTRRARDNEQDGVDYHFVEDAEFDRMLESDELLEWAEVHGRRYGTCGRSVDESLSKGRDVLLDIDTQGADSVRHRRPEAVTIFIMPPDFETLDRRLRGRGQEVEKEIQRRIGNARREVERYVDYDYVVINDSLEEARDALQGILLARKSLCRRLEPECRRIVETFRRV